MTPILTRIARDIDEALGGSVCQDAIRDASNGGADLSLVHWRFLADVLRAMQPAADKVQAVIDPVIAGMDKLGRGEEWTEAEARTAVWVEQAEAATRAAEARAAAAVAALSALSALSAVRAASLATLAAVSRAHQRDILLRLIEEANV